MTRYLFLVCLLLWAQPVAAQVAFDACTESSESASSDTFTISHTPAGTPRGIVLFVVNFHADADKVTSVDYGGSALVENTSADAHDAAGEPGQVQIWFLGSSVPSGMQTLTVTRTNDTDVLYGIVCTVTAGGDTEIYTTGIVLLEGDDVLAEQSVDDGSPGTNSVRFAGGYTGYGNASSMATGANSTAGPDHTYGGLEAAKVVYETTAGQGSRSVGFTQAASDDRALSHFAIRQAGAAATEPSHRSIIGGGIF